MNGDCCENCLYWREPMPTATADCRRHAPKPDNRFKDNEGMAWWPETHKTDWCGEHTRR